MAPNKAGRGIALWLAVAWLAAGPALAGEPAAIVEDVTGGNPGVAALDLLEAGAVVPLAEADQVVIGYLASCAREYLGGPGQFTVGTARSTLEGASLLDRRNAGCTGGRAQGLAAGEGAALRLRSVSAKDVPIRRLAHRLPVLLVQDPATTITIEPQGGVGKSRRLQAKQPALDTKDLMPPLESGVWLVRRGEHAVRLDVPENASDAAAPVLDRLVRF